jgi:hypothetical protein
MILSVFVSLPACGETETTDQLAQRRAEVAEIGAAVMPFDLDATTHVFEKLESGGRQVVRSNDNDPEQVALVRAHLSEEAARFAAGDFHDPGMIHGDDMPGLHALVVGYERIRIEYSEVDLGAQILYTTDEAELIGAIHEWFDAQLTDHGEHARSGR